MDVQLYVYDLTHGMARDMSRQFLGIQIDAVYHTAIVFDNVEYFFGAGVQMCSAGSTHHGRPMEIIPLGVTHLDKDTIMEYLGDLRQIYTPESYDLFAHNCNNFSHDFGMFLVGKGIPEHITNLPKRVLETPFGQMLRPQIDASMRSITQAELPSGNAAQQLPSNATRSQPNGVAQVTAQTSTRYGSVIDVTSLSTLDSNLSSAKDTCATIFFTSATCAPCKMAYPTYDTLAEQYPEALFVKVDIGEAQDVGSKYQVRGTPTFMTFSRQVKQDEWVGADPRLLKSNVEKVIHQTFPPHKHTSITAPALQFGSLRPVTYAKVPPLDKLMGKLGATASEPEVVSLRAFVEKRQGDARNAALPDLKAVGNAYQTKILSLPLEIRFAAVDLLRCAMVDQRVSGFFAEQVDQKTILTLLGEIERLGDKCPHNLRLVTIHLASNLFTSHLFTREMSKPDSRLSQPVVHLVTSSLLDATHPTTRAAAASLAFNLATSNYRIRREDAREAMDESAQTELAASILEALPAEETEEAVKALLLSIGYLVYFASEDGELRDLCQALDAKSTIDSCKQHAKIAREVASLL